MTSLFPWSMIDRPFQNAFGILKMGNSRDVDPPSEIEFEGESKTCVDIDTCDVARLSCEHHSPVVTAMACDDVTQDGVDESSPGGIPASLHENINVSLRLKKKNYNCQRCVRFIINTNSFNLIHSRIYSFIRCDISITPPCPLLNYVIYMRFPLFA